MRIKQVILIRKDLKMRRGKEIAQGSHAAMEFLISQLRGQAFLESRKVELNSEEQIWVDEGMAKICLRVESEEMLVEYHEKALSSGLKSFLIRDSGRTEFGGVPTLTACAIGPASSEKLDPVTGELVLY